MVADSAEKVKNKAISMLQIGKPLFQWMDPCWFP